LLWYANPMRLPQDTQDILDRHSRDTHTLPHLARALRDNGWTLSAIAEPLNLTRERIRQIIGTVSRENQETTNSIAKSAGLHIPEAPPRRALPERKESVPRPEPLTNNIQRMKELQPYARQVRANSPLHRAEGEEFTTLIAHEHLDRGVSLSRLGRELGVTPAALRFRLVRYGHKQTDSEHKVYKTIATKNRTHTQ